MEKSESTDTEPPLSSSRSPSPTSSSSTLGVLGPCAACKVLRRKCTETCVLAPHFPPDDPLKFAAAHRVFGASNIIKLLQELPERQRGDAVRSVVYEAKARLRDPVYGCAGIVCELQRRIVDLQAQVAMAEAELFAARSQRANLVALLCMKTAAPSFHSPATPLDSDGGGATAGLQNEPRFNDDGGQGSAWESLLLA